MRLTLRNLLAYLNDIIEDPADIEEMRRKIEESEFATGLVHRIRSATSRARLGAPSLEGRGIGLDANSVAEYLDNELPPDRIPDLEKICVESDVHLAEVAACYQILAMYMKGTGEVERGLRDRICAISETGEHRPRASVSAAGRADQPSGARAPAGTPVAEPLPPPATMVPPSPPRQPLVERALERPSHLLGRRALRPARRGPLQQVRGLAPLPVARQHDERVRRVAGRVLPRAGRRGGQQGLPPQ